MFLLGFYCNPSATYSQQSRMESSQTTSTLSPALSLTNFSNLEMHGAAIAAESLTSLLRAIARMSGVLGDEGWRWRAFLLNTQKHWY